MTNIDAAKLISICRIFDLFNFKLVHHLNLFIYLTLMSSLMLKIVTAKVAAVDVLASAVHILKLERYRED